MADTLSPKLRSQRMSLVKAADTKPEMVVRRLVHALGFRYRLHVRSLPGTPDLVFPRLHKVIFIHGCFWHRHRRKSCKLARLPKSRLDFWVAKLEGNRIRDLKNKKVLRQAGWSVLEVWECQLGNIDALSKRILYFLDDEIT